MRNTRALLLQALPSDTRDGCTAAFACCRSALPCMQEVWTGFTIGSTGSEVYKREPVLPSIVQVSFESARVAARESAPISYFPCLAGFCFVFPLKQSKKELQISGQNKFLIPGLFEATYNVPNCTSATKLTLNG